MVDKQIAIPLWVQVQSAIEGQIRTGELKPGSKIPSEHELAEKYAISRLTVRRALQQLVSKDLLFTQPGKGTFVVNHEMPYGFSGMLSFSRSLTANGHVVTTRVLEQMIVPGQPHILKQLRLRSDSELIVVRRLRVVDGIPAAIHASYFDPREYAELLKLDLSRESLLAVAERIGGTTMSYSNDSIRAIPSNNAESALLEIKVGSPLMELEGIVFSDRNLPMRYTRGVYRGDMFRLEITSTARQASSFSVAGRR